MKQLYKECKNIKAVNGYLRQCRMDDFQLDENEGFDDDPNFEFDFDGWINEEENKGLGLQINRIAKNVPGFKVSVTRYTRDDIEKFERELLK